ncbi:MAG: hypothetical protein CMN77_12240 [Spirochaetaceae bacterium]|nr:hypothetical protein [Spirochaetaceae bacterium]|tara:strand:- start:4309 stop:6459 length:2151 start_codon:yes stop_codon:yes gene_type:complete
MVKLQDHSALLESLGRLLNPPPGEDFSAYVASALRTELKAAAALIGEIPPGGQELQVLSGHPQDSLPRQLDLSSGPLNPILDGQYCTLGASELEQSGLSLPDIQAAVCAPLIDPYGQTAGAIFTFFEHPIEDSSTISGILALISPRIAEEMERKQAEELILQATEEIDHFSTSLKEIHRLNVTDYDSLEALFQDYLETGCRVFEMEAGAILQQYETGLQVIHRSNPGDDRADKTAQAAARVIEQKATLAMSAQDFSDANITAWVGSPVFLEDDAPAIIAFYSSSPLGVPFELFHQEILELMARSVSSEAQRRQALKRIQELKKQQDGDYFLTSLLIRPLSRPDFVSENHKIQCVANQKKTFSFRHWDDELGGDLATAYSLDLNGRKHIALFNADAMGKSMQGAGGALVCGSVFTSIIKRTRKNPMLQKYSPERWLKHAFLELNDVFHSFDSSMLISVNMALIDEDSGTLYYVVAEHPLPVLYRNGRARFLPDPYHYRKLGFQDADSEIVITIHSMDAGDCLIMGSDGRDDILIPDSHGSSYMNEDEHLFLRIVEEVDGDLDELMQALHARGELTDDLSLLHLKCIKHKNSDARSRSRDLQYQAQSEYSDGRFEKAYGLAMEAIELNPALSESMKIASFSAKMLGRLKESADLGERLFLRYPDFFPNTIHLSNVHYLQGNLKRARDLFLRASRQKPDHPSGRRMEALLRKKDSLITT